MIKLRGTELSWSARTGVISTPLVALETLKIHVLPAGRPARHGDDVGTVVALRAPTAGTFQSRCASDVLDFPIKKSSYQATCHDRRMFRRGDLGGIRIGRRRNGLRLIARARVNASCFCGSDVIAVGVTEQNHMHVAKPRIRRTGYSLSGVVKESSLPSDPQKASPGPF